MNDHDKELWEKETKNVKPLKKINNKPYFPMIKIKVNEQFFNPVIDLHGYKVNDAYNVVLNHIDSAYKHGYRYVTVITGRSGSINAEFTRWVSTHHKVRKVSEINGGGAYEVYLKKEKQ